MDHRTETESAGVGRLPLGTLTYWFLVALQVGLIWSVPSIPSQDGASHVASAQALRHLLTDESSWLHGFFQFSGVATPSWSLHLLLAALLSLFAPAIVEQILASLYVLLFAASARFLVGSVVPHRRAWALVFLPFSLNYLFSLGFYAFSLGFGLLLAMLGWWWPRRRASVGLAVWGVVLWWLHPVVAGVAAVATITLSLYDLYCAPRSTRRLSEPMRVVVSFLPVAAGVLWIRHLQGPAQLEWFSWKARWNYLLTLDVVSSFRAGERLVGLGLSVGLAGLLVVALAARLQSRKAMATDGFLVVWCLLVILYLVVPNQAVALDGATAGAFVSHRLLLLSLPFLLLWLASQDWRPGPSILALTLAAGATVALLGLQIATYRAVAELHREVEEADRVLPQGEAFAGIHLAPFGRPGQAVAHKVRPLAHAAARLTWSGRRVDLAAYQPKTHWHFPLVFRSRPAVWEKQDLGFDADIVDRLASVPTPRLVVVGLPREVDPPLSREWSETWHSSAGLVRVFERRVRPQSSVGSSSRTASPTGSDPR